MLSEPHKLIKPSVRRGGGGKSWGSRLEKRDNLQRWFARKGYGVNGKGEGKRTGALKTPSMLMLLDNQGEREVLELYRKGT